MNRYATQGKLLVQALMRRPMTYLQMIGLGCGYSPWRRVQEALRVHYPECQLKKGKDRAGNTTWRVVRPSRWTA